MATALGYDQAFLQHRTGMHPERPARLTSIVETLRRDGLWERAVPVDGRVDPEAWIRTIHSEEYIERLDAACRAGLPFIDCPDSAICPDSCKVARLAVSVTLGACDMVMSGEVENGLVLPRPPGHHAEADRSMGFCLFNNIAIAARYLQQQHGLQRILILDWDVHHGNGTQHAFEKDPSVFYCSIHQHPATLYPGTGWPSELGEGLGRGATLNLPLPPGAGDEEFRECYQTNFLPIAQQFYPDFVLISAGFDGHRKDPLAQLNMTEEVYRWATEQNVQFARQYCKGRLLSVLEGGYQLGALSSCTAGHLEVLMKDSK